MADPPTDGTVTTTSLGHTGHTGHTGRKGSERSQRSERSERSEGRKGRKGKSPGPGPERDSAPGPVQDAGLAPGPGPAARAVRLLLRALAVLVAFAAMVVFAALLSRLTLEPSAAAERLTHTNLRPGDSIRGYFDQADRGDAVRQFGGNIALGVPFGILLPVMITRARGALRITLCVALVMLAVELVQGTLVTGRAFDIDDVILNATGALAGYLVIGRRMGRAVHPKAPPKDSQASPSSGASGASGAAGTPGASAKSA